MRGDKYIVFLAAFVGCGGSDDGGDVRPDGAADTDGPSCTGCSDDELCCPSRFEGDVDRCVDPDLNPENCGRCGNMCAGACSEGNCIEAPACTAGDACADADLTCSAPDGGTGRCCPAGTTFVASPSDFFGCCPDGDVCGCREGNCPISLAAYKTNIRYLGPEELAALGRELLATRLATWQYRAGPERRQLGFVIDDGIPAHGIAADRAHVDLYGYVSLAVASLQLQAGELAELRADVAALKAQLETQCLEHGP